MKTPQRSWTYHVVHFIVLSPNRHHSACDVTLHNLTGCTLEYQAKSLKGIFFYLVTLTYDHWTQMRYSQGTCTKFRVFRSDCSAVRVSTGAQKDRTCFTLFSKRDTSFLKSSISFGEDVCLWPAVIRITSGSDPDPVVIRINDFENLSFFWEECITPPPPWVNGREVSYGIGSIK